VTRQVGFPKHTLCSGTSSPTRIVACVQTAIGLYSSADMQAIAALQTTAPGASPPTTLPDDVTLPLSVRQSLAQGAAGSYAASVAARAANDLLPFAVCGAGVG
jgi:hypothetical protein